MVYISQIYFQDVQGTYFLSISEFPGSGSCAGLNRRSRAKRDQREWLGHGAKKQQLHFLIAITFLLQRFHFLPPNQPMPKIMQRWVFKVVNIQFSPSRRHNAPSLFYTRASSSSHLPFQDGANKAKLSKSPVSVWNGDIVHSTRSQCGALAVSLYFWRMSVNLGRRGFKQHPAKGLLRKGFSRSQKIHVQTWCWWMQHTQHFKMQAQLQSR